MREASEQIVLIRVADDELPAILVARLEPYIRCSENIYVVFAVSLRNSVQDRADH